MLGERIFPYCFYVPHLIICAGGAVWAGERERSLLSILTSLTPDFSSSDTCGLQSGGGPVRLGMGCWSTSTPHTPHAMTASSGHPDRLRGARSSTSMFLLCVWPSSSHHRSVQVCQGCVKAFSHLGIPSHAGMGSQLRPKTVITCSQRVLAGCAHVVQGTACRVVDLYLVQ